jgi:hypothetical protein
MSIAWATVVLVVLLTPGFSFVWGFYAPHQVTRESVPASPLGQLAGAVVLSFFAHGLAHLVINSGAVCRAQQGVLGWQPPCIDFDQFAALLRIDGVQPAGRALPSLAAMVDASAGWIVLYFGALAALCFGLGFGTGKLVEAGLLPITRHRYLSMLEQGRRQRNSARLVRAHVLSRTAHDDVVLLYDGIVQDFFSRADGTITYLALRGARSGALEINKQAPRRTGQTTALDPLGGADASTALLVLTSEDIANIYFEPLSAVTVAAGEEQALDEKLQRLERGADLPGMPLPPPPA